MGDFAAWMVVCVVMRNRERSSMSRSNAGAENGPLEVRAGVAAIVNRDGRFLLIRRGKAPSQGLWAFPGGSIMAGEPLVAAAIRELAEETGVEGSDPRVLAAIDVISPAGAAVPYHFILVPVLLRWVKGEAVAADDAAAAGWFTPDQMRALDTVPTLWPVLADAQAALGVSRDGGRG